MGKQIVQQRKYLRSLAYNDKLSSLRQRMMPP